MAVVDVVIIRPVARACENQLPVAVLVVVRARLAARDGLFKDDLVVFVEIRRLRRLSARDYAFRAAQPVAVIPVARDKPVAAQGGELVAAVILVEGNATALFAYEQQIEARCARLGI